MRENWPAGWPTDWPSCFTITEGMAGRFPTLSVDGCPLKLVWVKTETEMIQLGELLKDKCPACGKGKPPYPCGYGVDEVIEQAGTWIAQVVSRPLDAKRVVRIAMVFNAIYAERAYQDGKWGPLERQNDRHLPNWFKTIEEELQEAEDAYYSGTRSIDPNVFLELVQVAAVAIAALEQLAPDDLDKLVRKHRQGGG